MIRPLPKPFALLPRNVRHAVRTCAACAGSGEHDPDMGFGSGERVTDCKTCAGAGVVPQRESFDALPMLARWRRLRHAAPRFYAHARRVAFQPVRLPGGAA